MTIVFYFQIVIKKMAVSVLLDGDKSMFSFLEPTYDQVRMVACLYLCHRGGKRTWPDRDSNPGSLAYRASTLPLSYRATRSTGYISPCFIRFVPNSARNHVGTDETFSIRLLLAARARTHTEPPNVTGAEKEHGPTGTRTQGLSLIVRALYL